MGLASHAPWAVLRLCAMQKLLCHAQSANPGVSAFLAKVERTAAGLAVGYRLEGKLDQLHIPPPRPARSAAGLWESTCCEIFVARAGAAAYHEFNLSPSGEWAAHAFERYRKGRMLADETLDPRIVVRRGVGTLELDAVIRQGELEGKLLIGLCAVIEAADGSLSYWALRHPAQQPDFHLRDAFALELG